MPCLGIGPLRGLAIAIGPSTNATKTTLVLRLQQLLDDDARERRQELLSSVGDLLVDYFGPPQLAVDHHRHIASTMCSSIPSVFHARDGAAKMPEIAAILKARIMNWLSVSRGRADLAEQQDSGSAARNRKGNKAKKISRVDTCL